MSNITFQYPAWFFLLCLVLGAIYALGLYYKDTTFRNSSERSKGLLKWLSIFRFLLVSFISFLLLAPFIRNKNTEEEKPIVVIAQDNSLSIKQNMSPEDSVAYVDRLNSMIASLSGKFNVNVYTFGETQQSSSDFSFSEKSTDIAQALNNIYDNYINQNLGAIVLASDGIYNKGNNPIYSLNQFTAPVYTVALGDTTRKKDVKINKVYYNSLAYLGDRMEVLMDIEAFNCSGETANVSVVNVNNPSVGGRIFNKRITFGSDNEMKKLSFTLDFNDIGVQQYLISINPLSNESNTINNRQNIFIDVLDSKQKILLIANSPHPDLSAIKASLTGNRNYEVDIEYAGKPIPNIKEYSLAILHQIPSLKNSGQALLASLEEYSIPTLFVLGTQSSLSGFNSAQGILEIKSSVRNFNKAESIANSSFSLFKIPGNLVNSLPEFPPLEVPFGNYILEKDAYVLLFQKIGAVTTHYPILALDQSNERRIGVLTGEGVWRWRFYDYLTHKNQGLFDDLMFKTVQFLAVKSDKRKFRVNLPKKIFGENEPVFLEAELYNENYEPVNDPDISIIIIDAEGKEYPFNFNRNNQGYELRAGFFPTGNYQYYATVNFNGSELNASGQFSINQINLESIQTVADHHLLYLLSNENGGKLFYPEEMDDLTNTINTNEKIMPLMHETYQTNALINFKWLFFIGLGLLAFEWFIRKFNGAY